MRLLYDIFFILFSIFYLPYFLLKGKYHADFAQRFGIFAKGAFNKVTRAKPIWLHAVSVGEVKTAEALMRKIRDLFPSVRFVISSVTKTGRDIAAAIAGKDDLVIYFPLDLSFVVRRAVKLINPAIFIVIETEIWPNLITELYRKKVPVVLVNGRLSPGSFRNYRLIKPVIKGILNKFTLFCMRTKNDAERIKKLGAPSGRLKVTGNMKFDGAFLKNGEKNAGQCFPAGNRNFWLGKSSKLIIAGSTHQGEDGKILKSYRALRKNFPELRLLIAPRHIERSAEIGALIRKSGFKAVRLSEIEKTGYAANGKNAAYDNNSVFILDSMGRLGSLYEFAAVVFMGGSFVPRGGHNFIEPAMYSKPMLTGPHIHNFRDMSELFIKEGALEVVNGGRELENSLRRLISDESICRERGQKAKKVILDNVGAAKKNALLIKELMSEAKPHSNL
ncbi:MAG: 3-deoxy-D-manno-octulosonic acid transferase [Candidatus Omnitrophota bacterium]|nr:3-deoxy-D-manno-octulosonic acid transferase [Candidatus Omnitrophota bacterium]